MLSRTLCLAVLLAFIFVDLTEGENNVKDMEGKKKMIMDFRNVNPADPVVGSKDVKGVN